MKRSVPLLLLALAAIPAPAGTDCWTYVPGSPRGTISWTDSSGFENVVQGIELDGTGVKIKANLNRNSTTLKNLDMSLPVRDEGGGELAWSPDVLAGDNSNAVLGYITGLTNIVLPSVCTSLGRYCFKGNTGLVRVRLNDGLVSIGSEGFNGCSALATVENFFPDSLQTVGATAFRDCTVLTGVPVANGLVSLGSRAFHTDKALQGFDCGNSTLAKVDDFAFYNCTSLARVVLPDTVTNISDGAFSGCSVLRDLSPLLPPKLEKLGTDSNLAVGNCPLEGHVFSPPSLERIGTRCFRASKIETFTAAKKGLKSIGQFAFYQNYDLTNVVLSTTMESIAAQWLDGSGRSGVGQHVWFRNLPASLPSGLWQGTKKQNVTVHLPLSKEKEWRAWVASAPSGHAFAFDGTTGILPEHRNDVGTWTAGVQQYVTWWKDVDRPTMLLVK